MHKIQTYIILRILIILPFFTYGQTTLEENSSEFCGQYFTAPNECKTMGNMIQCKDYVFTWSYEPIIDLPRHQKELIAQIKNPKEIKVSVLKTDLIGYLSKVDSYDSLLIVGSVNGKGVIINLYLDKTIKATNDLPECVRQFITIK
ncbi:hypothetical protein HKT18_13155 [Flavobacterium sp. IMCC34852]|uniref:Uncharacterized protein n=1 Tax=Flavobacterium rivulicola TaxID=2732161 RepID=A0A7Y3RAY9_9FLAO|nr:hypothetical protein [Flavobacterium sp. IMCC34852]NNT73167.1 hypothetical protein [Flavobacterium sp. IMCC34852]